MISQTYFSIIKAYCKANDVNAAISLFRHLRRRSGLRPSLDMHIHIISTLATNSDLR